MIFDRYDNTSPPHDNKLKPKHKKSRSDNFNIPNDKKDDNSTYYNLFLNYPAPKEFFANISPSNNSRFIKIFNSESEKSKDSIFKFPNESSLNFNQKEQRERSAEPSRDLSNLFPRQTKPPMFYVGTTPPGLTPNKNDFLKTTDEDSQIYQKKNQFKAPDQVLFLI